MKRPMRLTASYLDLQKFLISIKAFVPSGRETAMINRSTPPPTATEVTVTAPDRLAALEALLQTGLQRLTEQTTPGEVPRVSGIPLHLIQVSRVLHDEPGPDGHTIRAHVALPYGVLERAALRGRPELTGRPLHLTTTEHTGTRGSASHATLQTLQAALTHVGFTVTPVPGPGSRALHAEAWVQARGTLSDMTHVTAAQVHVAFDGQVVVTRNATGSGATPQMAAHAALTLAANLAARPLVLALLGTA